MKHGRRHRKLKEQAYMARKDAEGYAKPYGAIDVAQPERRATVIEPDEHPTLAKRLGTRAKKQLKWHGIEPDDTADDASGDAADEAE